MLSSLLGVVIVFLIRILPTRVIDRTLTELATTQARYHLLFDANPFPMVVVHRESLQFLAVNDAAVEHYGWSREEFLTMKVTDLRTPDHELPRLMLKLAKNPAPGAATFLGQRHRKRDGTIIDVEITTRAIEFDGQPAALSLAVDVTDRIRAEEQLRQSQKMEVIGQLTGGIAHDFNNILSVIVANIDALEEEPDLAPDQQRRLKRIGRSVWRATELTRQLLAFSRKQPLQAQVTDLNELITGTVKLLRRSLGQQIEIRTSLASELYAVNVDRAQLESALVNLSVNARDAMPDGGQLRIETSNITLRKDDAGRGVRPGDYALLAVSDTGRGMSSTVVARIFEPFFTTKDVGKGTGLGLSMVYGFIKQSNGHIEVQSEPGRGTTFRLYLPRSEGTSDELAKPQKVSMPRGVERLLVVDDNSAVRVAVVEQLKRLGYDVTAAADGAAGLVALEDVAAPFELLLTDVLMPGMTGGALAGLVAQRWPKTKIVFMSGYAEDTIVHQSKIEGGVTLLIKPFQTMELAQAIRLALDAPALPVRLAPSAASTASPTSAG